MPDPAAPTVAVRRMTAGDVRWTARCQAQSLAHGLFPRLGPAFVRRWHLGHVLSPYGVALLAERDGVPVGYVIGAVDQREHVAWTVEHERWQLAVRGALGLLVRPRLLATFARTRLLRYARRLFGRGRSGTRPAAAGPAADRRRDVVAVVMALAVDPAARGSGAGRALVARFLAAAAAAGSDRTELVTVAGPAGASDFYGALGWEVLDEHRNRDGVLVRRFGAPRAASPRREDGVWLEPRS